MATRIVVGLGNPGEAYEDTRHNLGFEAVDRLAAELGITLVLDGPMWIGSAAYEDLFSDGDVAANASRVVLVKPATYMNLSGRAVECALAHYPTTPADLMVVVDDMSLETGAIRLRRKGSDGGHNGLKSIIAGLGTVGFPRLRIGIGPPAGAELGADEAPDAESFSVGPFNATDHVLGRFTPDERERVDDALARAARAALAWIRKTDMQEIMNTFNRKPTPAPDCDESGGDKRPERCSDGES